MSQRRLAQLEQGLAKTMHPANRVELARALNVDDAELNKVCCFQERPPSAEFNVNAIASGKPIEDRKNLIRDKSVSERILHVRSLPSFAECVDVCSMKYLREGEKDAAIDCGWKYNHFLQAAAAISAACTGSDLRYMLGYYRAAQPDMPEHTPGLAVLWGASFSYNVRGLSPTAIDRWIDEVRCCPVRARNRFTAERGSVFSELLEYKIKLRDLDVSISPYAVITNDQRDLTTGEGRVYTQFVYDVRLAACHSPEELMATLEGRPQGFRICVLPQDADTAGEQEKRFCNPATGKLNLMDVLAWRGMFTRRPRLSIDRATLTKGFDLLPRQSKQGTGGQ